MNRGRVLHNYSTGYSQVFHGFLTGLFTGAGGGRVAAAGQVRRGLGRRALAKPARGTAPGRGSERRERAGKARPRSGLSLSFLVLFSLGREKRTVLAGARNAGNAWRLRGWLFGSRTEPPRVVDPHGCGPGCGRHGPRRLRGSAAPGPSRARIRRRSAWMRTEGGGASAREAPRPERVQGLTGEKTRLARGPARRELEPCELRERAEATGAPARLRVARRNRERTDARHR